MHAGSITSNSAAARVYRALCEHAELDGWTLSQIARVTAVSTRVSECNAQLGDRGERIVCERKGHGFWYRLERVGAAGEQMELIA